MPVEDRDSCSSCKHKMRLLERAGETRVPANPGCLLHVRRTDCTGCGRQMGAPSAHASARVGPVGSTVSSDSFEVARSQVKFRCNLEKSGCSFQQPGLGISKASPCKYSLASPTRSSPDTRCAPGVCQPGHGCLHTPMLNCVSRCRSTLAPHRSPAAAPAHHGLDISTLEQPGRCGTTCPPLELGRGCRTGPWSCPAVSALRAAPQTAHSTRSCVSIGESLWQVRVAEAASDSFQLPKPKLTLHLGINEVELCLTQE